MLLFRQTSRDAASGVFFGRCMIKRNSLRAAYFVTAVRRKAKRETGENSERNNTDKRFSLAGLGSRLRASWSYELVFMSWFENRRTRNTAASTDLSRLARSIRDRR